MQKIYSIYKITNTSNSKVYIGFTSNMKTRWYSHCKCYNSNTSISKAIQKYGIDSFVSEVIYQSKDKDHTLNVMEKHFINEYNSYNLGYNSTLGGSSINAGIPYKNLRKIKRCLSEDAKKLISVSTKASHERGLYKTFQEARRKKYTIKKNTGEEITFIGLRKFCRENGYFDSGILSVARGDSKYHKDIVNVIIS